MTNIGVVILNYVSYDVTLKCVEYFQKQSINNVNVKIVVVDNDSPNDSFSILNDRFKSSKKVKVIKTTSNLGFANGNNFGYKELCKIMKPDFVIMSNSDAYVKDDGLYNWIINCYKKYNFGVLGPAVYSVRGKFYQSPMENESTDLGVAQRVYRNMRNSLIRWRIKEFLHLPHRGNNNVAIWDNPYYKDFNDNKTLHGAFQIFSSRYFDEYELPYDSHTFMYMEENIVKLRCDISGLPMIYSPDYTVYHLQAISTSNTVDNKAYFRLKNSYNSRKVYIDLLKKYQDKL